MLSHIITENSITILIKGKPAIIDNTHVNFAKIEECVKNGCSEEVVSDLMNISKVIQKFVEKPAYNNSLVTIENGEIFYNGEVVNSALSRRILSLIDRGFDISPFTKFMENLYKNPSYRAVNELYGFLEACNLPITEDGHFLAYKKITSDYLDCYTKTIDNSIGSICEMPRNKVNEDCNVTCSYGLHVASYSYMTSYSGDRIVICKINPRDVVAVPTDYNNAKMRVCKYKVVNEVSLNNEEIQDDYISNKDAYHENCYVDSYKSSDGVTSDYSEVNDNAFSEEIVEDGVFYTKQNSIEVSDREESLVKIENLLSSFDVNSWDVVKNYLDINDLLSLSNVSKVCFDLRDTKAFINKLKNTKGNYIINGILAALS